MANNNQKGNKPDFVDNIDLVAWQNTDDDGNSFVSVRFGNGVDLHVNQEKLKK